MSKQLNDSFQHRPSKKRTERNLYGRSADENYRAGWKTPFSGGPDLSLGAFFRNWPRQGIGDRFSVNYPAHDIVELCLLSPKQAVAPLHAISTLNYRRLNDARAVCLERATCAGHSNKALGSGYSASHDIRSVPHLPEIGLRHALARMAEGTRKYGARAGTQ